MALIRCSSSSVSEVPAYSMFTSTNPDSTPGTSGWGGPVGASSFCHAGAVLQYTATGTYFNVSGMSVTCNVAGDYAFYKLDDTNNTITRTVESMAVNQSKTLTGVVGGYLITKVD